MPTLALVAKAFSTAPFPTDLQLKATLVCKISNHDVFALLIVCFKQCTLIVTIASNFSKRTTRTLNSARLIFWQLNSIKAQVFGPGPCNTNAPIGI